MLFSIKPVLLEDMRKAMESLLLYKAIFTTSSHWGATMRCTHLNNVRNVCRRAISLHPLFLTLDRKTSHEIDVILCQFLIPNAELEQIRMIKMSEADFPGQIQPVSPAVSSFTHLCLQRNTHTRSWRAFDAVLSNTPAHRYQNMSFRILLKIPNNETSAHTNTEQYQGAISCTSTSPP